MWRGTGEGSCEHRSPWVGNARENRAGRDTDGADLTFISRSALREVSLNPQKSLQEKPCCSHFIGEDTEAADVFDVPVSPHN